MESLTDLTISKSPVVGGAERRWMLKKHDKPNLFEFAQIDGWTLLGWSQDQNPLLENLIARIHNDPVRFPGAVSNFWLEASLDVQRSAEALLLRRKLPEGLPSAAISVIGDGTNIRTRADFTFPKPLELEMEPWIVPTNIVREPLISFTAVRGIARLWQEATLLSDLKPKNIPNQLYFWALARIPFQTFAASPLDDTTNFLKSVGPQLADRLNSKSAPNSGSIIVASNGYSLVWTGVPFATPYLRPEVDSGRQFLFAGLFPNTLRTNGPPKELLDQFVGSTNVTYYDWEVTQERVIQLRYIDDLYHIAFDPAHKPRLRSDLASVKWLGSIATNLGNSVTEITLASSNRLSCQRKSSAGLTGVELELLANWFESPDFPSGFSDFLKINVNQSVPLKENSLPAIK